MSSEKPLPSSTAAHAAALARLLGAAEPAAAETIAGGAEKHFERERRPRPRGATVTHADAPGASSSSGGAVEAARAARGYFHRNPTRSPVLNAFLNELGGHDLVPANVDILNEHVLALRLVELAHQHLVSMLLATGKTEVGLVLAAQMRPITSEHAARLFLRQAARVGGELGAIARDYEQHRRRSEGPEPQDQRASCVMSAFAGRMLGMAEKLLGSHMRGDVRSELERLTSQGSAPARRRRVSELRAPQVPVVPEASGARTRPKR